jgi:ribosomal protein L32
MKWSIEKWKKRQRLIERYTRNEIGLSICAIFSKISVKSFVTFFSFMSFCAIKMINLERWGEGMIWSFSHTLLVQAFHRMVHKSFLSINLSGVPLMVQKYARDNWIEPVFNLECAIDPLKRPPAQNKFNCGPNGRTHRKCPKWH